MKLLFLLLLTVSCILPYVSLADVSKKDLNVLVTGSREGNGLGFHFLKTLRAQGYSVSASARDPSKTSQTVETLQKLPGEGQVYGMALDVMAGDEGIRKAVQAYSGPKIDVVVLNAVKISQTFAVDVQGVETLMSTKVVGHHLLLVELERQGKLSASPLILGVGSEASMRDGLPFPGSLMLSHPDLKQVAQKDFNGDLEKMFLAGLAGDATVVQYPFWSSKFDGMQAYSQACRYQNFYFQELARQKPSWKTFVASPGNIIGTDAVNDVPWPLNKIMPYLQRLFGHQSYDVGVQRWLDIMEAPEKFENGKFYASAPKRVEGPMGKHPNQEVDDALAQNLFQAVQKISKQAF